MRISPNMLVSYWQRYVRRRMDIAGLRRVYRGELFGWNEKRKSKWLYTEDRPWTDKNISANIKAKKSDYPLVQPIKDKDWHFYLGDRVEILIGKDKGKQGIISSIIRERNWCFVKGLNCKYVLEGEGGGVPGIMIAREKPLRVTDQVKLVDPSDEMGTDVDLRYTEDGNQVRVSTRSGRIIPTSSESQILEDFINPATYKEQPERDTLDADLTEITFVPKLKTFDEDILDQFGIKDDRKPAKTFWY